MDVGEGEWQSEDSFVCFGAKPTQRAYARFPTRPEEDEERQGLRAVNKSWGKAMVRERRLPSEELGPVDSEIWSAGAGEWVGVPGGCVGVSLGCTLAIVRCTENHTKVIQTSPSLSREQRAQEEESQLYAVKH